MKLRLAVAKILQEALRASSNFSSAQSSFNSVDFVLQVLNAHTILELQLLLLTGGFKHSYFQSFRKSYNAAAFLR